MLATIICFLLGGFSVFVAVKYYITERKSPNFSIVQMIIPILSFVATLITIIFAKNNIINHSVLAPLIVLFLFLGLCYMFFRTENVSKKIANWIFSTMWSNFLIIVLTLYIVADFK